MSAMEYESLFTDKNKVRLTSVSHEPTDDIPVMDFNLEETGNPRSAATLSYSFETRIWKAQIRQSETDTSIFDSSADATDRQLKVLIEALPEEVRSDVLDLQKQFDDAGIFDVKTNKPT